MSKPGGRAPGGKPSGRLLGSGSKGRQGGNVKVPSAAIGQQDTDPSKRGNPDVVQSRLNVAMQGTMQKKQLRSNRSKGIGALGKLPSGGKPKKS